ncbi:ABC transporter substrate-binding protein [Desulfovibrio legallii]|jgi:iron(III) transport system substrate-binding protein|uniref:Iron(III) transport system substrate-binding protein n=1 Tax=Desulfovibrio legallii TaxID=571438 RepID=A0A1G7MDC6_9BACT|nr:ABC transporter substrate-binding protein [Desulfovibrio legallii]SDF59676.1 iron(III) transport system substrate-binding protein [Desulfovibrio legallii]
MNVYCKKLCALLALVVLTLGLAVAAAAKEVVLYSSNQPDMLDAIALDFEKKTGIKLTVVRMGTGEAMKRIAAERANPLCDVFWSGDVAVLDNAKADFMPYKSPQAAALPAAFVEKDHRWTAANMHLMVIMANTRLVPPAELPKSWKELLDPKWKNKVVMANPLKSGSAYAQVYGIYKLYGWDGLKKLIDNVKILDSSSLVYKGTAEGEFPLAITMEYAAHRYVAGGAKDVRVVYPADGVIAAPEGAAIIAGCKHPEEAKALVDYLLSQPVVDGIFQKYFRRPARPDAVTVKDMPTLQEITLLRDYDPAEANTLQKQLLAWWKKQVLQK